MRGSVITSGQSDIVYAGGAFIKTFQTVHELFTQNANFLQFYDVYYIQGSRNLVSNPPNPPIPFFELFSFLRLCGVSSHSFLLFWGDVAF